MRINENLAIRLHWACWFVFANIPISWFISTRLLQWISIPDGATATYVVLVFIGQFALLAWVPGLVLVLLALLLPSRSRIMAAIMLATLFQLLLFADMEIYSQYRFHLSGFLLDTILNSGSQTFHFSANSWLYLFSVTLLLLAAEIIIVALLRFRPLRSFWLTSAFTSILLLQVTMHGWHAWADAKYDARITGVTRHIPLYHAATAKRLFSKFGIINPEAEREERDLRKLQSPKVASGLVYPAAPLTCRAPEQPYNVLMIIVDALRGDMIDSRWTPNLTQLSTKSLNFVNHMSGGNSTKSGIFSLFYGLPTTYWDAFSAAQLPPVLIERMQSLDYRMKILSAATLISPAFDRTVFASVPDVELHPKGKTAWQRDRLMNRDWLEFTADVAPDQRFFGVLFYKSVHSYSFPEGYARFEPHLKSVDHFELSSHFDPEPYLNNYRTAAHYVDSLIGPVLADLETRGLMENTVILVTSDHGEEFNDNGRNYWGHGSNYSQSQLHVPMIVHWPGKPPAKVERLTSHMDVASTFMQDVLGCGESAPALYSSGSSLLAPPGRAWFIAGSYIDYALVTEELIVVNHPTGRFEVMDEHLNPQPGRRPDPKVTKSAWFELSRFYR